MGRKEELVPCRCTKCAKTVLQFTMVTPRTRRRHEEQDTDLLNARRTQEYSRKPENNPITAISTNGPPELDSMDTSPTVFSLSLPPSPKIIAEDSHDVITDTQDLDFDDYQDDTTLLDEASRTRSASPEFIENVDNAPTNPNADNPVPSAMNHAGPGADDEDLLQELVPAFQQTPPVRLLYLQAAITHIIGSSTVAEATNQIQDGLDLIELCGALPTFPIPRRSIITVKKHLGLQTDDYVSRIPICDVCYKRYSLDDIQKLDTPICTVSRCKGNIYRMKREHTDPATGEDRFKCIPVKVLVYCPIVKAVQCFLLRSAFVKNLRDTSQDINRAELSEDDLMHDIHDGAEWTKLEVGLKRHHRYRGVPRLTTWLFGFERFNGVLEDVNLNGHGGGGMEYSLARDWVEKHRLYELAISLPEGASDKEHKLVQRAIDQKGLDRGTLRTQIAQFTASSILPPRLTSKTKFTSLRGLQHPQVYQLLVGFLQHKFPNLNVVDDMTAELGTTVLFASPSAKVLPFIVKDGIRFGSATATRTNADQFAVFYCSAVQKMVSDDRIPAMPWDRFATDLGVNIVYENIFGPLEIIASSQLSCAVAIIPITTDILAEEKSLWVVQFFDRMMTGCAVKMVTLQAG
ncbi:hypothetical protein BDR05DRAFT_947875 [Suillus weaverae]|nr:hypothetical protein BDR05DRAFT_947875 [Suillus weaverae]